MPDKIFVSYRRDDDPHGAARIRAALTAKFGRSSVFMDVNDLRAGLRFDEELVKALAACDVFLSIIGPRWIQQLKTKAASGDRDHVGEEIAEALRRKILVIPARIGREGHLLPLPHAAELPPRSVNSCTTRSTISHMSTFVVTPALWLMRLRLCDAMCVAGRRHAVAGARNAQPSCGYRGHGVRTHRRCTDAGRTVRTGAPNNAGEGRGQESQSGRSACARFRQERTRSAA